MNAVDIDGATGAWVTVASVVVVVPDAVDVEATGASYIRTCQCGKGAGGERSYRFAKDDREVEPRQVNVEEQVLRLLCLRLSILSISTSPFPKRLYNEPHESPPSS